MAGKTVSRYRIFDKLWEGRMGTPHEVARAPDLRGATLDHGAFLPLHGELELRSPGIVQCQVRQTEPAASRVSRLPAAVAYRDESARGIRGRLYQRFGAFFKIEVRFVEELEHLRFEKILAVIALRRGVEDRAPGRPVP